MRWVIVLAWLCWGSPAWAAIEEAPAGLKPSTNATAYGDGMPTNAPLKDLGDGRWQIGKVMLNKKDQSARFPAVINMTNGLVEYLVVAVNGKLHESLLRTDAQPWHIHLAMLLLGAKGAQQSDPALFLEAGKTPPGDAVRIEVVWTNENKAVRHPAESLIRMNPSMEPASIGPWVYNGSRMIQNLFAAQDDGSIAAIMGDPYAMINNPRKGHEDDEIWTANPRLLPEVETPCEVILRLELGRKP